MQATLTRFHHPALTYLPNFLTPIEQSLLLTHSLLYLSSPSSVASTSHSRSLARSYRRELNSTTEREGFLPERAYAFEPAHSDRVIRDYRETIVPTGAWNNTTSLIELQQITKRLYDLIPPPTPLSTTFINHSPPEHLLLHLLHLSATGAIDPHVDNMEASGDIIIGLSLGSDRIMRFEPVGEGVALNEGEGEGAFEVLLEKGSVYIQRYGVLFRRRVRKPRSAERRRNETKHREPLRSRFKHSIPATAMYQGRSVGGEQRLSLMLRVSRSASY